MGGEGGFFWAGGPAPIPSTLSKAKPTPSGYNRPLLSGWVYRVRERYKVYGTRCTVRTYLGEKMQRMRRDDTVTQGYRLTGPSMYS